MVGFDKVEGRGNDAAKDIAVIVPVYNVEAYLERCVLSLLDQTYPAAEIILVDDGSTDSSGRVCDEYASKYPVISVVHKRNGGLGFARNSGMDAVKNRKGYIAFVDADDWLEPDALEKLIGATQGGKADCVMAGFSKISPEGRIAYRESPGAGIFFRDIINENLLPRLCGSSPSKHDSIPMSVWACLFKVEIIDAGGLRFHSEREIISEDFVFKFEYLHAADMVVTIDACIYNYRTNDTSLTKTYRPDRFDASLYFYDYALNMIVGAGLSRDAVLRLQKSFLIYLRMCIGQEKGQLKSGQSRAAARAIKHMLSDDRVSEIVKDYPISNLGLRQRIFARIVLKRRAKTMFVFLRCGLV